MNTDVRQRTLQAGSFAATAMLGLGVPATPGHGSPDTDARDAHLTTWHALQG
ncbi:hypothetical protein [Luteipulveratus halotolerans]|uniref:hypothetical protein n=1 Tax=Luteipulveratus halotolerans TaxID=1631356 RepID=UPI0012FA4CB0|nr:hypothetical protein [Luteipulveratus halotolerans]